MNPHELELATKQWRPEEDECVKTLLDGVPKAGGTVKRATFEKVIRMAFMGGVTAVINSPPHRNN